MREKDRELARRRRRKEKARKNRKHEAQAGKTKKIGGKS